MNNLINRIALILTIIGAINWGAVAFDQNLVTALLGTMPQAVKAVYALVGASGLWTAISYFMPDHNR